MRRTSKVLGAIPFALYPFGMWMIISYAGNRIAGVLLLVSALVLWTVRLRQKKWAPSAVVVAGAICVTILVGLSLALNEMRFLLGLPVMINVGFLFVFGASLLRNEIPMVERFARLVTRNMTPERVAHCRNVTIVWCGFFVINGLISLWLAMYGSLRVWSLYTGGISYALMGTLFVGEYAIRRIRFG